MVKRNYSNSEKIEFYRNKIKSLEAKIASEEREPFRDPAYPTERLYKRLDDTATLLAALIEIMKKERSFRSVDDE